MSKPAEKHAQILEQILRPFDLSHDFGRKRAYEAAIDYARENLIEDPHCNDFLGAAAKRLGFAPITFDTLESRVKVPKNAWLDVWISDEDEEVASGPRARQLRASRGSERLHLVRRRLAVK